MSTSEWTVQLLWGLAGLQERKTIQAECENEVGNLTDGILAHRWDEAAGDPIPPDYDLLYFLPFPWRKSLQSRVFCTETVQRHQLFRLIDMCSYLHRCCWPSLDFQGSKCNQEKAEFSFGTKPEFVQILHIELLIMCENPFGLKLQTGQREVRETKTEFSNSMHSLLPKEKTFRHIKLWQKQLCKCTWKWAGIFQD